MSDDTTPLEPPPYPTRAEAIALNGQMAAEIGELRTQIAEMTTDLNDIRALLTKKQEMFRIREAVLRSTLKSQDEIHKHYKQVQLNTFAKYRSLIRYLDAVTKDLLAGDGDQVHEYAQLLGNARDRIVSFLTELDGD